MQAVGSVWNKNAWHWEEKNCTKWGKETIVNMFEEMGFTSGGYHFTISKGVNAIGESNVNVRKQKLLYLYEFTINGYWKAISLLTTTEVMSGSFKILERNQDDDDITLEFSIDSSETPAFSKAKSDIRKMLIKQSLEIFNQFMVKYKAHINDEMLKATKEQQVEETKKLEDATKCTVASTTIKDTEAKGSEWNVNSYHWEEKPLTKWALDTIKEKFALITLGNDLFSIPITFISPAGEANINIRKGKKILMYDISINLDWSTIHYHGEEESKGSMVITEFSTDNNVSKIKLEIKTSTRGPDICAVEAYLQKEGKDKIVAELVKFLSDMKEK